MSRFEFNCPNCGIHEVGKKQFYKLLSGGYREKVKIGLRKGAIGAGINFTTGDGCPECRETGFDKGQVYIIWPKFICRKN